jgi:peptide/nickel transport system permease protein
MGPGGDLFLGTDQLGRDTTSRLMFGAWNSMKVAIVSVVVGITTGTLLGVFSGHAGGKADLTIQRVVDALMGFPPIILAPGPMAALGASDRNVTIALTAIFIPGATRVIRSQALSIKELDYMLAARAIGAGSTRIVMRHMLPNVAATYIVLVTLSVGFAIVVEASLSFLGVGIPPDVPTWGGMLQTGRQYIDTQAWLALPPMIAIGVVVFSVNFLGGALRDVLDPKLRGRQPQPRYPPLDPACLGLQTGRRCCPALLSWRCRRPGLDRRLSDHHRLKRADRPHRPEPARHLPSSAVSTGWRHRFPPKKASPAIIAACALLISATY